MYHLYGVYETQEKPTVSSPAGLSLQLVFLLLIQLSGLILNIIVLFVIIKRHRRLLEKARYIFLINVVTCNLVLLLWVMPVTARVLTCNSPQCFSMILSKPICFTTAFLFQSAYICCVITQVLLALDRTLRVLQPIIYVTYFNRRLYLIVLLSAWLFAMVNAAIPVMPIDPGPKYIFSDRLKRCTHSYVTSCWYDIYISILVLVILAPIIPCCHFCIAIKLCKMKHKLCGTTTHTHTLLERTTVEDTGEYMARVGEAAEAPCLWHSITEADSICGFDAAGLDLSAKGVTDYLVVPMVRGPPLSPVPVVEGYDIFPLNVPMVHNLAMSYAGVSSAKQIESQEFLRQSCPLPVLRTSQHKETQTTKALVASGTEARVSPIFLNRDLPAAEDTVTDSYVSDIKTPIVSQVNFLPSATSDSSLFRKGLKKSKRMKLRKDIESSFQKLETSAPASNVRYIPVICRWWCLKMCFDGHTGPMQILFLREKPGTRMLLRTASKICLVRGVVLGCVLYMCTVPYAIVSRCPRGEDTSSVESIIAMWLLYSTCIWYPLLYFFWHDEFIHNLRLSISS